MSSATPPSGISVNSILNEIATFANLGLGIAAQFTPAGAALDAVALAMKIEPFIVPGIQALIDGIKHLASGKDATSQEVVDAWQRYEDAKALAVNEIIRVLSHPRQ